MKKQEQDIKANVMVYQHRRVSDGEIFYIGIGAKNRPYSKLGRNNHWLSYTNKYDYVVDVLFRDLTWEEACIKEKSLILEYGRHDLKQGTLVNKTDGGEGNIGRKDSQERIEQKRLFMLENNPMNKTELREKVSSSKKGKPRLDMVGIDNPNFKPGVQEKKSKAWQSWIDSDDGLSYKQDLKSRYANSLGSDDSKRKAAVAKQMRLSKLTKEQKSTMTSVMNASIYECPYCNKVTNIGNFNRWHNEKCKLK